jgi:DNA-binding NarL/FixJ family response regulator
MGYSSNRQLKMQPKILPVEDSGPTPIKKVFIVEDHPVFREGLVQIINSEGDLTVCGEAEDAEHALEAIPSLKPDLALVDIGLPGKSGLELIKDLRARKGGIKLLVLSMHDEALYADRVLRAGGDGYIMKQEDPEEVVHAIRDVLAGRIYVSEEVLGGGTKGSPARGAEPKSRPLGQLTDMELEVLELLGEGKTDPEIARQLRVRAGTASAHCTQIKKKLNLKSINALIRYAVCWVEGGKA